MAVPSCDYFDDEYGSFDGDSGAVLAVLVCAVLLAIGVHQVVKHCKDGERALKQTLYDSTTVNKKINDTIYVKTR